MTAMDEGSGTLSRRMLIAGGAATLLAGGAEQRAEADTRLVAAARREPPVRIYSNMSQYNWRPVLAGLRQAYPTLAIETIDMGPTELFERYYAESAAGRRSADMLISNAPDAWLRLVGRGQVLPYRSSQIAALPGWSLPFPGLYTLSADPMLLIYNKALLDPPLRPTGLRHLAQIAATNPRKFRHRITTYDAASHALAYALQRAAIVAGKPGGWDLMQRLAPYTRLETGGATMLDKVTTGEYLAGFHVSAVTVLPQMRTKGRAQLLDWTLCRDGTPLALRGMAITKATRTPAGSRLVLDWLLSRTGQIAAANGGLTPCRRDIGEREVPFLTIDGIVRRLGGTAPIVLVGYDRRLIADYPGFIARWKRVFAPVRT